MCGLDSPSLSATWPEESKFFEPSFMEITPLMFMYDII